MQLVIMAARRALVALITMLGGTGGGCWRAAARYFILAGGAGGTGGTGGFLRIPGVMAVRLSSRPGLLQYQEWWCCLI